MKCPNCPRSLTEQGGKFHCEDCGWFENVGDPNPEWHTCEAPEPVPEPTPAPEPDPAHSAETLEDIQASVNPPGVHNVKKILGGIVTVTEIDDEEDEEADE